MARSQLVACVLVSLAASALALELCPERSSFNGCRRRGCITVPHRRTEQVVCDDCGEGYQLVNRGTTRAKCECAPGYAGRGNDGICKKCPEGTDIAPGGSVVTSECLRCPSGTAPSRDRTECTCSAGSFMASNSQVDPGFVPVTCKMCTARNQYITGNFHTSRSCSTCPNGQVANKAHTWCVDPSDADAVPEAKIPGMNLTLTDIQDALRGARKRVEEARIASMDSVSQASGNPIANALNPVGRLSDGIAKMVGGEVPRFDTLAPPKLPNLQDIAKGLNITDAARFANITSLQDFTKQFNLTSLNPAELAKLNITSVPQLLKQLNATAASLPPVDGKAVLKAVGAVGERIAAALPTLPDPMYILGLRLDPAAMADAGLPAVKNVPELFSNLMTRTVGDLDTSDWNM